MDLAFKAQFAGVDAVIVDWESKGKQDRQKNHPLEINHDTPQDVYNLAHNLKIPVIVRINLLGPYTPLEIKTALNNGAKILMLPMAKAVEEVNTFLTLVDGRAETLVQIETPSLASDLENLKTLDWDYAYLGLNDLMVATGRSSIWQTLIDGTAESICQQLRGRAFGFGGSTVLGGGEPINNALILHELVRLGGSVSIMRRTFKKELLDRDLEFEMAALRQFVACSQRRGFLAMQHDHEYLLRILASQLYPQQKTLQTQVAAT